MQVLRCLVWCSLHPPVCCKFCFLRPSPIPWRCLWGCMKVLAAGRELFTVKHCSVTPDLGRALGSHAHLVPSAILRALWDLSFPWSYNDWVGQITHRQGLGPGALKASLPSVRILVPWGCGERSGQRERKSVTDTPSLQVIVQLFVFLLKSLKCSRLGNSLRLVFKVPLKHLALF